MKKLLIAIFIIGFCPFTQAQQLVTKAKLSYVKYLQVINEATNFKSDKIRKINFVFNKEQLVTESNLMQGAIIQSVQKANETNGICYLNTSNNKVKFEDLTSNTFDIGLYDESKPLEYLYTKDTSTINGVFCKYVKVKYFVNGTEKFIDLWYDSTKKLNLFNYKYLFANLNGMPVQFSYVEKPKISFAGTEDLIMKCKVTLELFDDTINDDVVSVKEENLYQLVDKKDAMQYVTFGKRPKTSEKPKGEEITKTITDKNGTQITLTKYNPFKVGEKLQPFVGQTLQEKLVNMENLKEKVLVLNFWFLQCKPCIKEMPILNEVKSKFVGNKDVDFYSITYEKSEEVKQFLKTTVYNFTAIVDAQSIIDQYNVFTYPATVIIDKKGIIQFVQIGEFTKADELTIAIEKVLKK